MHSAAGEGKKPFVLTTLVPTLLFAAAAFGVYRGIAVMETLHWNFSPEFPRKLLITRIVLSAVAAACGLIVLFFGVSNLWRIRRAGAGALRSHEEHLRLFQECVVRLPWIVVFVGVLLAVGLAALVAGETIHFAYFGSPDRKSPVWMLVVGGFFAVLPLAFACKLLVHIRLGRKITIVDEPRMTYGVRVDKKTAPALHRAIGDLAAKTGLATPEHIVLGIGETFFATESRIFLNQCEKLPRGKVLHLPLLNLFLMPEDEAAAVIAHELSHFQETDPEKARRYSAIHKECVKHLIIVTRAIGQDGGRFLTWLAHRPTLMLCDFLLESFHHAHMHWSRTREYVADGNGARAVSARAMARSLFRIVVLAAATNKTLADYWQAGGHGRDVVARIEAAMQSESVEVSTFLEQETPHPTDSHPTVRQRVEALGEAGFEEMFKNALERPERPAAAAFGIGEPGDLAADGPQSPAGRAWRRFTAGAAGNFSEVLRSLTGFAGKGKERREYYEQVWSDVVQSLAVAVLMAAFGFAMMRISVVFAAGLFIFALAIALYAWHLRRRSRSPFLILTDTGFRVPALAAEVQWENITEMRAMEVSGTPMITLTLSEEQAISDPGWFRQAAWSAKNRRLVLTVRKPRGGVKFQELYETFVTYCQGRMARKEKERLKDLRKRLESGKIEEAIENK